jgi:PelA/Pel-15E family pectate lyase
MEFSLKGCSQRRFVALSLWLASWGGSVTTGCAPSPGATSLMPADAVANGGTAGTAEGSGGAPVGAGAGGSPSGSGGAVSAHGGSGGAPAAVDCSLAGSVPVSVGWSTINQQPANWYATPEALSLAENILYYRNSDGGWPKEIDMTGRTEPRDVESTIDNDATTTQIEYLARVYSASSCSEYGDAATAGIEYLLDAQYDNGGWPQIFPDPQGYAAHITFNDDAMVHVMNLLRDVAARSDHYAFADVALASNAAAAVERGIGCILATQVVMAGSKTAWCAQHDEVTLAPAQARSYELPSLSGSEGADLFGFLMTIENPSPEVIEAVQGAAAWFEAVKLTGIRIDETVDAAQPSGEDRVVVQDAAAPALWARFYELGTNRPIFSSRCEVDECDDDPFFMRRYSLAEIDNERRVGYAWYGNWPARLLSTTYPAWQARWAP